MKVYLKKFLCIFISLIAVTPLYAQNCGVEFNFIEEGKTWEYTSGEDVFFYSFSGDTIIDGKKYKKVCCRKNDGILSYFGACRELGGEVFIRFENAEKDYLLYDFSFPERMISNRKEESNSQEYEGHITLNGQKRRIFAVQECYYQGEIEYQGEIVSDYLCPNCHTYTIEGIGHVGIPFTRGGICNNTHMKVRKGNNLIFDADLFNEYKRTYDTDVFFSSFLKDNKYWYVAEKFDDGNYILVLYSINGKINKNGTDYFKLYRSEIRDINDTGREESDKKYVANIREDDGKLYYEDIVSGKEEIKYIDLNSFYNLDLFCKIVPYSDIFPDSYVEENEMQEEDGRVFRQQVIRRDGEDGYVARDYIRESVGGLHFPFRPTLASNADEEKNLPVLLLCQGADGTVYYEADHNSELWQKLMVATSLESIVKRPENKGKGIYDLQGRRVSKLERGIYIQDGRKVIR